jgi:hypothetical protein
MGNADDIRQRTGKLTDVSRNKLQASVLLNEVARNHSETAVRKRAQSARLREDCRETIAKSKKLRERRAG